MNDILVIPIYGGIFTIVDSTTTQDILETPWSANPTGKGRVYIRSGSRGYLHRVITGAQPGMVVDHINGNPLDNRSANLRVCTHAENLCNLSVARGRSGYIGVYKMRAKWQARVHKDGVNHHCGTFSTPEEAARVRDKAAISIHGEFASLNFPDSRQGRK